MPYTCNILLQQFFIYYTFSDMYCIQYNMYDVTYIYAFEGAFDKIFFAPAFLILLHIHTTHAPIRHNLSNLACSVRGVNFKLIYRYAIIEDN